MRRAALERLFARERARFAARYPRVARAHLVVADRACTFRGLCGARDLAYCYTGTGRVVVLRRALRLPDANLRGLIRHELGHIAAPLRSEQHADDVAERVTGRKIRYDRRDVQTTGRGAWPRPAHLPR